MPYITKIKCFSGSDYKEVYPQALSLYKKILSKTRRRPYVRSRYFSKEKVFLDYFWEHMRTKNHRDRTRRLRYYACGLDLIEHSTVNPTSKQNPNKLSEILYRFTGETRNKELFCVQIKEDSKRKNKYFMSVFPIDMA